MIRKILLAYDGSEPAAKAFRFSADLAKRYGAELHVLTVAQSPDFGEEVETKAVIEHSRNYHESLLKALRHRAAHDGIQARFELQVGHVAQQILDHAANEGVDLIVLGHRGRGLMDRWRLGSVSHRVISYADCAVTVVR
jgi:nucleotide-binding universal stress UspA family protein